MIRPLAPLDIPAVLGLLEQLPAEAARWNRHIDRDWIEGELAAGASLGLWYAERLAAVIFYRCMPHATEIMFLMSHPHFWRQGLMGRLWQAFRDRVSPVFPVWLEVHQDNDVAQNFYRKQGFREVGRRPDYYGPKEDAVLYSWEPDNPLL